MNRVRREHLNNQDFDDNELNVAIASLQDNCPGDWAVVLDYINWRSCMPAVNVKDEDGAIAKIAMERQGCGAIFRRLNK